MRSRILERKLGFLQRVLCASRGSLCGRVVETWCDSITSLCLVKECRELEEMCGVMLTDRMLKGELAWSRSLKEEIRRVDHNLLVERCAVKAPLIAEVEESVGWARLWDGTLNFGIQHTRGLQVLSRVMSHHGRGCRPCPLCESAPLETSVFNHVLCEHFGELGPEPGSEVLHRLVDFNLSFLAKFRNLYSYFIT